MLYNSKNYFNYLPLIFIFLRKQLFIHIFRFLFKHKSKIKLKWKLLYFIITRSITYLLRQLNNKKPTLQFKHPFKLLYNYNNIYISGMFTNISMHWSFFNKDPLILLLVKLLMKDGKKHISYIQIYKAMFLIKKTTGLQPIWILKKSLYQSRFLFDLQYIKLKKRTLTIPKLLSIKSQLTKSIKYIFNNLTFKLLTFSKKLYHLFEKIVFLLLNHFFKKDRLTNLISNESLTIRNNFYHLKKENFLNKYATSFNQQHMIYKQSLYKKKFKSFTKKDKMLIYTKNQMFSLKRNINLQKKPLFSRYRLNLQSKLKIRNKWF